MGRGNGKSDTKPHDNKEMAQIRKDLASLTSVVKKFADTLPPPNPPPATRPPKHSPETPTQKECPACHLLHHNLALKRCRSKSCRSLFEPQTEPAPTPAGEAPVKPKAKSWLDACSRSVFTELKVLELFEEDQAKAGEPHQTGDNEGMEVEESPLQDPREAALQMLEQLKAIGAPPNVLACHEATIAALPKAKTPKPTQPIHNLGKLHHALGLAKDFHLKQADKDTQRLQALQANLDKAQAALTQAKEDVEASRIKAAKEEADIQALIHKHQSTSDLGPVVEVAEEQGDRALLSADLKTFLQTANCPPHRSLSMPCCRPLRKPVRAAIPEHRRQPRHRHPPQPPPPRRPHKTP